MILVLVGIVIYANSFSNSFVWDDELLITGNNSIRSFRNLPRFFTSELAPEIGGNFYRPLQSLSYAIDYLLWGLKPFGYHLTNVLIHISNAILIYLIFYLLVGHRRLALLTALFFLVHPVQTEAVTYISGRADIQAGFFMLLSLLFSLAGRKCLFTYRPNKTGKYKPEDIDKRVAEGFSLRRTKRTLKSAATNCIVVISFVLALLTKEAAVVLPFLVILCGVYFPGRNKYMIGTRLAPSPRCDAPRRSEVKRSFVGIRRMYYALLFSLAAAYLLIRVVLSITGGEAISSNPYPFYDRFLTSFKVILLYLKTLLVPVPLHMERVVPIETSLFSPAVFFPLLFFAGVMIGTARAFRKSPSLFFGIAWFFVALFPYLNWFPLNAEMAEHWLYLPSIGFFFLFAFFLHSDSGIDGSRTLQGARRLKSAATNSLKSGSEASATSTNKLFRMASWAMIIITLIGLSALTIDRNRDWRNNETIYLSTVRHSSGSPRAHYNLGNLYLNRGEFEKAGEELRIALAIKPWDFMSRKSRGKALLGMGRLGEAIKELEAAVSLRPSSAEAHGELGVAYGLAGFNGKAVRELTRAIELTPGSARTRSNLASVYTNRGEFEKALVECRRALELDPDFLEASFNLGVIYYHLKRFDKADAQFKRVLELKPDFQRAVIWREKIRAERFER